MTVDTDRSVFLGRAVSAISFLARECGQPLVHCIRCYLELNPIVSEPELNGQIRTWSRHIGRPLTSEENAERLAFLFRPPIERAPQMHSPWGTYYGPIFEKQNIESGRYFPDLSEVTAGTIEYWKHRAENETHPVVKARYADLVWDIEDKVPGNSKSPVYGVLAVQAYVDIADTGSHKYTRFCWSGLQRAMSISKMMKRDDLGRAVVEAMIKYEDSIAEDDKLGTWGEAYKILVIDDESGVLSEVQQKSLVKDVALRFRRLVLDPNANPNGVLSGFKLLTAYFLKRQVRVPDGLCMQLVQWMFVHAKRLEPIVGQVLLIRTYFTLHSLGAHAITERVLLACETLGLRVVQSMTEYSRSFSISAEELDKQTEEVFSEGTQQALTRIAEGFLIPAEDELRDAVSKDLEGFVAHRIMPPVEIDGYGRPLTAVSVNDDGEGMMYHKGKTKVLFQYQLCFHALSEFAHRSPDPISDILSHCYRSPFFEECRRPILERGIRAYLERDHITCVSILVPEIEHLLRHMTRTIGIPTWMPNEGQTFHVKTLGRLLSDDRIKDLLGPFAFEIKFIFADLRGFNIRNDFSHGLMSTERYNEISSTMLVHILLFFGLFREGPEVEEEIGSISDDADPITASDA